MTTSALEKRTGVPRTAIYFYIRRGLLPAPQKTATGRSLYGEAHVDLLRKIGELKRGGRSLVEIKRALEKDLARGRESELDLATLESARVRAAIIEVATEQFASKGYKGTHVLSIIQKLGINPHIFYRHFPSKLELLAECFKSSTPLPIVAADRQRLPSHDPGENVLRGLTNDYPWHRLSAVLSGAIRSEGLQDRPAQYRLAETWDAIIVNILEDFQSVRAAGSPAPPVSDELIAYSLIGAHRSASIRASWDDKFKGPDLLKAHLFVFFALLAAVSGEVDIYSRVARYEGLIEELTAGKPDLPPALEI
ncbi:MAG: hypothetical protein A2133_08700 [Actinobacteria bacterium RBG_16_64_13]|nr:MAG: hypothetical protein A2133_08700 [Actinobacteria bacterium RBG_16_64_13]